MVPKGALNSHFLKLKMVTKSLFFKWFGSGSPIATINRKQQQALNTLFLEILRIIYNPHPNHMIMVQPASLNYELNFVSVMNRFDKYIFTR